jgi:hypothetical protein
MNGRTALGACLVVLAVLAGALFLDRSQQFAPVYMAARDLPAGAPLKDGDLVVIRVRLPAAALRHYLQPGPGQEVSGRILTAPVRRETLVPAGVVLTSSQEANLVELPVQVDRGDMAQGLRPGDSVQVLAAYTEGARRGRAVVLLPSAEVVQVLQDPAGLAGTGEERGVQLRMPSHRAPLVAAAIATARIFVVKAPGATSGEAADSPPAPVTPGATGSDAGPGSGADPVGPDTVVPEPEPAVPEPDPGGPDPYGPAPAPTGSAPASAGSAPAPAGAGPAPAGAGPAYPPPGPVVAV